MSRNTCNTAIRESEIASIRALGVYLRNDAANRKKTDRYVPVGTGVGDQDGCKVGRAEGKGVGEVVGGFVGL